jgi:hypothetical protein
MDDVGSCDIQRGDVLECPMRLCGKSRGWLANPRERDAVKELLREVEVLGMGGERAIQICEQAERKLEGKRLIRVRRFSPYVSVQFGR